MEREKNGKFAPKTEDCVYSGREKEYKHEWYLKNIDKLKKLQKERYQKNKDSVLKKCKEWQQKNPELVKKYKRKNKEAVRFGGNRAIVLERDNNKCVVCGKTEMLVVHHKDNTNNRGKSNANNNIENLVTLCKSCHLKVHRYKMKI